MDINFTKVENSEDFKTLEAYQLAVNVASIVSITDLQGEIIYVNENFVKISGYSADDLIGNTHRIINSGYHSDEFYRHLWETIKQGKVWRGEMRNKSRNGDYYWVDTVITPVMDGNNKIYQYLAVRNLITSQKQNEEKLLKSQQQLKDAQQVSKTGSWHLDTNRNSLEWSEETYHIFEIPVGTPMTYESFLDKVHPDDRKQVNECWQKALLGSAYDIEHRIITASGIKWIRECAHLGFDESGDLTEGIGTAQDITEKKHIEETLRDSETLYRSLFNNSPFPKGIVHKESFQFLEVNETASKVYGYSRDEFLQMTTFDIRVKEEHEQLREQLYGNTFYNNSVRTHRKKNGNLIKVEAFINEINYKGMACFLITINDVTERLKLQDQLIREKQNLHRKINRASIEAQEKYRAEIARELHDNINQWLVASNMYLKNVHPALEKEKKAMKKSLEINRKVIGEIRKLSQSMVPPSLGDLSLEESIGDIACNLTEAKIKIAINIKIKEEKLSEGLKVNLYRIVQEQINNIIKHAEATQISLDIRQDDHSLSLEIIDNGKGFDPKQKLKGIGLTNIIYRVDSYNGKTTLESSPGCGCRVYTRFSLSDPSSLNQQEIS